jgi:hypothetical protein
MTQDQCGDTSMGNIPESVSPQGPLTPLLLGGSVKGVSGHGRNSMDADDEQSANFGPKIHTQMKI